MDPIEDVGLDESAAEEMDVGLSIKHKPRDWAKRTTTKPKRFNDYEMT